MIPTSGGAFLLVVTFLLDPKSTVKGCFGQPSPAQQNLNTCQKNFNTSQIIGVTQISCLLQCDFAGLGFRFLQSEDGTTCATGKECLNGACVLSTDVQLCQNQTGNLTSVRSVFGNQCQVSCVNATRTMLTTRMDGTSCVTFLFLLPSACQGGTCVSSTGSFLPPFPGLPNLPPLPNLPGLPPLPAFPG